MRFGALQLSRSETSRQCTAVTRTLGSRGGVGAEDSPGEAKGGVPPPEVLSPQARVEDVLDFWKRGAGGDGESSGLLPGTEAD